MLLWYLALARLGADLGQKCEPKPGKSMLLLRPAFEAALRPICSWPNGAALQEENLLALWRALLAYDAPPGEFDSWKKWFLENGRYRHMAASAVVQEMVVRALLNPYFLLND
jgi:hypothetical protein